MEQVRCASATCRGTLAADDLFCGDCGAPAPRPAPWPGRAGEAAHGTSATMNGEAGEGAAAPRGQVPFFEHQPPGPAAPLSNATRYLCAAAYLDRGFANDVIGHLVATRRSVAPSLGFDAGPVIRHCLRARKHLLIRAILMVVLVLLGLIVFPLSTINFLLVTILFGVLVPNLHWKQRSLAGRLVYSVIIVAWLGLIGSFAFLIAIGTLATAFLATGSVFAAVRQEFEVGVTFVILFALTWAIQFVFTRVTFRTLTEQLQLGAPPPRPTSSAAETRISVVEGAQWGNITLYATEDPFIGAGVPIALDGEVKEHWSIAVKLEPASARRHPLQARPGAESYVPIDPVDLHQKIRDRLGGLNDPGLPPNERIAALTVTDRLVGGGRLRWSSPLVDTSMMTAYSHASGEAIEAIIRHPQSGLRYYQQISVSDEGPPVMSHGQQVLESVDQGVAVSAFVYAAVEGRMFYLQFVLTALPPIHPDYRVIDLWPSMSSGKFLGMTLYYSLKTLFKVIAYAPAEIGKSLLVGLREWRLEREALSTNGSSAGDFGSLMSIRERGTDRKLGSYIRELDVEKYNKIFQRLLLETVQDYLAEKGVDVSAFEGSANSVINGDVITVGSVSGSGIQLGSGNVQRNTASSQSH
jgi:hypothetical protein